MIQEISPLLNILLLSFVASLGTGLGGLIAALVRPSRQSYGFLMGLTAGVMICLSFLELVPKALEQSNWVTATIGFALGAVFMFALDHLIPHIRFGEKEVRDTVNIELNGDIVGPGSAMLEQNCLRTNAWAKTVIVSHRRENGVVCSASVAATMANP